MRLRGSIRERTLLLNELKGDQYLIKTAEQGSVKSVLDIGAQAGLFTTLARLCHPTARIIAMEPDPVSRELLLANVDMLNVEVIPMALGEGGPMVLAKNRATMGVEFETGIGDIVSTTLPPLLTKLALSNDGLLVKCDCECGERFLIFDDGCVPLLRECLAISFELHNGYGHTVQEYMDYLRDVCADVKTILHNGVIMRWDTVPGYYSKHRVAKVSLVDNNNMDRFVNKF